MSTRPWSAGRRFIRSGCAPACAASACLLSSSPLTVRACHRARSGTTNSATPVHACTCSGSERQRSLALSFYVLRHLLFLKGPYQILHWTMPGLQALVGIPVAWALGMVNVMMFPGSGEARSLQRSSRGRWLLGILRKKADAIIILNPEMRKEVESLGFSPDRTHWFPCEVEATAVLTTAQRRVLRQEYGLPPEACIIVSSGRFVEAKRLHDLVRAFAIASRSAPGAVLALAGDGPLRQELEELVVSLGIRNRVYFFGMLSPGRTQTLLKCADVFAWSLATKDSRARWWKRWLPVCPAW